MIRCLMYINDCLADSYTKLVVLLLESINDDLAVENGPFDGVDLILPFALLKLTSFRCSVQFFQGGLEAFKFPCWIRWERNCSS